jgi:phage protein D
MAETLTLGQEALRAANEGHVDDGFYTPRFEVRIAGAGLPRDVMRDVTSITYRDNIKQIDGFDLTVNNWDSDRNRFKYVGSETLAQLTQTNPPADSDAALFQLFAPCGKDVEIRMGYLGGLTVMLKGNFTGISPVFSASAAPVLNVSGLNVLHKLRTRQYSWVWEGLRDSEIALNLRTLRDPRGGPRFPLPIDIDQNALNAETPTDYVAEHNQYDIDFLLTLARHRSYIVALRPDPTGRTPGRLYFGPPDSKAPGSPQPLRNVTFQLHWGRSLIEFKPKMTSAMQVSSVTVHGWNRRTRKPIIKKVTLDDARIRCNRDIHRLLQQCDPREEIVVTEPKFTEAAAEARALAILNNAQHEFVKCDATTIGLPDLRAGLHVEILNVGARFSGVYFITETEHTINDSGYITKFKAQRDDPGRVR